MHAIRVDEIINVYLQPFGNYENRISTSALRRETFSPFDTFPFGTELSTKLLNLQRFKRFEEIEFEKQKEIE